MRPLVLLLVLILMVGGCGGAVKRSGAPPSAEEIVAHLRGIRERVPSLRAQTRSEVWLGKERASLAVLIMAAWGGKVRMMALNPNDSMAADLASDGSSYCFLDANHDCGECGAANEQTVARLIRIRLPPDDAVAVLAGGTPILQPESTSLTWDAEHGHEILEIRNGGLRQRIVLEGARRSWDVLESSVTNPDGSPGWKVRHTDFRDVKTAGGQTVRLPGKSFVEQGKDSALIRWKEQEVGLALDDGKFRLEVPAGLKGCAQD